MTTSWSATLERLEADGLRRSLRVRRADPGATGASDGRASSPLDLASNDYLGLAGDERVVEALAEGAARYGVGAGASRLITGTTEAHVALESAIAETRGTQAALVYSSGYATNLGVLQTLAGRHDVIVADALCHASLLDGARLSGATLVRFRHNDPDHLVERLRAAGDAPNRFVVTEGVFSMDGDLAELPSLSEAAAVHDATLIVDDAHGTAITGPNGRGTVAAFGLGPDEVPVQIGTLSKAIGTQGGYVAGSRTLIDLLIHRSRSFVYSTGLSPAIADAARVSLGIARAEGWRRDRRADHARRLRAVLEQTGLQVQADPDAPMLLALLGGSERAVRAAGELEAAGVLAPAIRPPTVPDGSSRIRFAPRATLSDQDLAQACAAIQAVFGR